MVRQERRPEGVDIIDVHAHLQETPSDFIWPRGAGALLEDMDRCGVGVAIFSHLGALEALTPDALEAGDQESAAAVSAHRSRLRSYLVFQPHQVDISIRRMQRIVESDSPFVGFKLHGAFHHYPADGPNYRPAFQFAHEHKLPVLFHVGGIGRDWDGGVAGVADEFSGMNLILAHFGPPEDILPKLIKGRPNIFIDTSLTTGRHLQIERVVRAVGAEKVLFATDATFNSLAGGFSKLAFADLPEEEKKMIFGRNARSLFGKSLS